MLYLSSFSFSFSIRLRRAEGATLGEMLLVLLILAVLAIYNIPKIVIGQQNQRFNAIAKEAVGSVSSAYSLYRIQNGNSINTSMTELTPYLNYVRIDTVSIIDNVQTAGTVSCGTSPTYRCLFLQNGAVIAYLENYPFGGSSTTSATEFVIDPDGKVTDGTTTGPGKSVKMFLYYNGRITTRGQMEPGTITGGVTPYALNPAADPPWLDW